VSGTAAPRSRRRPANQPSLAGQNGEAWWADEGKFIPSGRPGDAPLAFVYEREDDGATLCSYEPVSGTYVRLRRFAAMPEALRALRRLRKVPLGVAAALLH
jgi:hypothetical protein